MQTAATKLRNEKEYLKLEKSELFQKLLKIAAEMRQDGLDWPDPVIQFHLCFACLKNKWMILNDPQIARLMCDACRDDICAQKNASHSSPDVSDVAADKKKDNE